MWHTVQQVRAPASAHQYLGPLRVAWAFKTMDVEVSACRVEA